MALSKKSALAIQMLNRSEVTRRLGHMTTNFFRVPATFRAGLKENPVCQINDAIPKKNFL